MLKNILIFKHRDSIDSFLDVVAQIHIDYPNYHNEEMTSMLGMMNGRKKFMKKMKGSNMLGMMTGAVSIGVAAAMFMRMRNNKM